MMDVIKTMASMAAIWALSLIICGVLARVSFFVFMVGWNLL